jgi:hypothetical protein
MPPLYDEAGKRLKTLPTEKDGTMKQSVYERFRYPDGSTGVRLAVAAKAPAPSEDRAKAMLEGDELDPPRGTK